MSSKIYDIAAARKRCERANTALASSGTGSVPLPITSAVADLRVLLPMAEAMIAAAAAAPRCGCRDGKSVCPNAATLRDPLDQLWCDTHGQGLEGSMPLPIAVVVRAVAKIYA